MIAFDEIELYECLRIEFPFICEKIWRRLVDVQLSDTAINYELTKGE